MEAERSHHLFFFVSRRPGKLVVQFSSSPKAQEPGVQSPRTREDGYCGSTRERKFTFLSLFVLFWPSLYWTMPIHTIKGDLLYLVYRFKCHFLLKTPSQTHLEIMFYQLSGQHLASSSRHIELTIIKMYDLDVNSRMGDARVKGRDKDTFSFPSFSLLP